MADGTECSGRFLTSCSCGTSGSLLLTFIDVLLCSFSLVAPRTDMNPLHVWPRPLPLCWILSPMVIPRLGLLCGLSVKRWA